MSTFLNIQLQQAFQYCLIRLQHTLVKIFYLCQLYHITNFFVNVNKEKTSSLDTKRKI